MFCPKCRSEFEAGYTRCAACDADLVESLPLDGVEDTEHPTIFASDSCLYDNPSVIKEYTDLVTVFQGDEGMADLIRAKLESCGIDGWVHCEPYLRLEIPILGQFAALQVRAADAEAALQVLEDAAAEDGDKSIAIREDPRDDA